MKHLFSTSAVPCFLAATAVVMSSSAFAPANAASMNFTINDFTGADTQVKFTLDDAIAGSGKVQFKVDYLSTAATQLLTSAVFSSTFWMTHSLVVSK